MGGKKDETARRLSERDGSLSYTLVYAALGAAWILASDFFVYKGGDQALAAFLSTAKGLAYVAATSLLLFWMMRRNVQSLRKLANDLAASELRFRGFFETAEEGFLVFDSGYRITLANNRMAEILACSRAELIGLHLDELMGADDAARFRASFESEGASGPVRGEWLVGRHGALDRWVLISAGRFEDPGGHGETMMALLTDIGVQKATEARIRELNADLERRVAERTHELQLLNEELSAFSYSVSHDLRAPLRAIHGFGRALVEDYKDRLDGEALDYVERMSAAALRMSHLIDGLLDLARASRAEMSREVFSLSTIAENVAADLKDRDPERDVKFTIMPDVKVHGDQRLLANVIQNLLHNAWKFTSGVDSAEIEFGMESVEGEKRLYVRDNGAGFQVEYVQKLFQPFQRLHTAAEFPGEGIGLATVHRIIQRHGGRIWAEGAPGEGAKFTFTLGY